MAGLELITPPTAEPVSLQQLKAHARIEDDASDPILAVYLQAAREYVEAATGRSLMTQTWARTYDNDWPGHFWSQCSSRLYLPKPPLQGVSSLKYIDATTGTLTTLDPAQYQVVQESIVSYITPAYNVAAWPAVRCQPAAVTVTWVAGYATAALVPAKLTTAALMLAAHWFASREATAALLAEIPFGVEALLSSDRVEGLL